MILSKCFVCGSTNLIADRALSGRLVCKSCGNPYGVRKNGRNKINNIKYSIFNKKYILFYLIFLTAFILVII